MTRSMADVVSDVLLRMAVPEKVAIATDAEVESEIIRIAALGYRPSLSIVEPIRAYLSGFNVLLTGDAGVGKTFLMQCLGAGCMRSADSIVEFGLSGLRSFYSWTDEYDIVIDDLGSEAVVQEYGNRDDILKAVIQHRIDGQTRNHRVTDIRPARVGRTHITTNLTAAAIAQRYGDRILSRVLGLCQVFKIDGPDMRTAKPAARMWREGTR